MKPFEEQFTAWVDGKLEGAELAEFEKKLASKPEAAADKEDAQRLGKLLRTHPTAPRLSNPDFFNHQIMQQIAAEAPRVAKKRLGAVWALGHLAWAGAACLAVAFALYKTTIPKGSPHHDPDSKYFAQVVEAWPS